MAFENLDLESKVYIPTQQLIGQWQSDLAALYLTIRQNLVEAHHAVAALGKEVYDNPLKTLSDWYNQTVTACVDLYAELFEQVLPQAEQSYDHVLAVASNYAEKTKDSLNYLIENPQQVSADAIEAMTESLSAAGEASTELFEALQEKSAEIVTLLTEHPLQTLESAAMESLSALLDVYFELVSALLASV